MMADLLEVQDVSIDYTPANQPPVHAVKHASLTLKKGEFVGLVGESGAGKSTLGFAIAGFSQPPAKIVGGRILFKGVDISTLTPDQLKQQRQGGFAMVLQAGMNALNPVRKIGKHFEDIFRAHNHVPREQWHEREQELLGKVGLPEKVIDMYPGEMSGGMRQRACIALALSLQPSLMVFDEPTTALDVLVQHEVMDTIRQLQKSEGFTAVLISHDLGIVLESTSRLFVMHDGVIVETGTSEEILHHPRDPYTRMLLSNYGDPRASEVSVPGLSTASRRKAEGGSQSDDMVLRVSHVTKVFKGRHRGDKPVIASNDVSFELMPGESLGLVGASGSGKSTLASMITGIEKPTKGEITLGRTHIEQLRSGRQLRKLRSDIQLVFQDPYAALNPLHTVEYTLTRPLINYTHLRGAQLEQRVYELLETVGLTPVEEYAKKLPHQLSGGQRQRVVIARALASNPRILIADEPVSMLDMTLRAGILELLDNLRVSMNVSLLYITHDLLSARLITDRIMVLNKGAVVESGKTGSVLQHPQDPYTISLLDSIPHLEKEQDAQNAGLAAQSGDAR